MPTPVQLVAGSLPEGYCYPANPQDFNALIFSLAVAQLPDTFPGIYVSNVEPPPTMRDRVWFHTEATKWYYYIGGLWQRKYDIPYDSKILLPFWGSAADINTEGGGSPGAPGLSTGPLWEIDHRMDGRVLMGAGVVPGTTTPVVTANQGDLGGEGQHVQTAAEVGPHVHPPLRTPALGFLVDVAAGGQGTNVGGTEEASDATTGTNTPAGAPMNITQPYFAGLWLKRTIRQYVSPPN